MDHVSVVHMLSWLKSGLQSQQLIHLQQQREKAGKEGGNKKVAYPSPQICSVLLEKLKVAPGLPLSLQLPALLSADYCSPSLCPSIPQGYCHHILQPRLLWRWQSQEDLLLK